MKRIPATIPIAIAIAAMLTLGMFTSSATAEENGKKNAAYAITWDPATLKVGQDGTLTLVITPTNGYKWNKQFPASFKITPSGEAAKIVSTDFGNDAFKSDGKKKTLKVRVKGAAAGQTTLKGAVLFSVCTEEACIKGIETIHTTVKVEIGGTPK